MWKKWQYWLHSTVNLKKDVTNNLLLWTYRVLQMLNLLLITLSYLFPTKPASCWYIYKVIMLIFHVPKQTCTFYNNQYICNKQCQNIESFVITNGQKKGEKSSFQSWALFDNNAFHYACLYIQLIIHHKTQFCHIYYHNTIHYCKRVLESKG